MLISFFFSFLSYSSKCELSIDNYVLTNASGYCDELIIPNNVVTISRVAIKNVAQYLRKIVFTSNKINSFSAYQFYDCYNLQAINLEALTELKEIPMRCFSYATSLPKIHIPSKVKTLGVHSFIGCTSLSEVIFDEDSKLRFILAYSFFETNLISFKIPSRVVRIFDHALGKCQRLNTISVADNNSLFSVKENVLFDTNQTKFIYYPCGLVQKKYVIPNTVVTICETAFHYVPYLEELVIPDSVLVIEFKGMQQLINLHSLTLSKNIQHIYDGGLSFFPNIQFLNFSHCKNLRVYQRFCKGCYKLEEIILPTNLNSVGEEAFLLCHSLRKVYAPERVIEMIKTIIDTSNITFYSNDALHVRIKVIKRGTK